MIYSGVRVIDGDTIEINLWPSGYSEVCRIIGVDTNEISTKAGQREREILVNFFSNRIFKPYIFFRSGNRIKTRWRYKARCGRGRLLVTVYVWRWFRYVNYSDWMKKKGYVKRGSKWND